MRISTDQDRLDAMLPAGEGDGAFDAWTLEELGEELELERASWDVAAP